MKRSTKTLEKINENLSEIKFLLSRDKGHIIEDYGEVGREPVLLLMKHLEEIDQERASLN